MATDLRLKAAEKPLREIRAELKSIGDDFQNWPEIARILAQALTEIRTVKTSDRVYVSRTSVERIVSHFESLPDSVMDDAKRDTLERFKRMLSGEGDERS